MGVLRDGTIFRARCSGFKGAEVNRRLADPTGTSGSAGRPVTSVRPVTWVGIVPLAAMDLPFVRVDQQFLPLIVAHTLSGPRGAHHPLRTTERAAVQQG